MSVIRRVCVCDDMPGLHHPELDLCMGEEENFINFTQAQIEAQNTCDHNDAGVFTGVCSGCGKVFEEDYDRAEEENKVTV